MPENLSPRARSFACLVLGLGLAASATAAGRAEPLTIFILAGQSNMAGYGDSAELRQDVQRRIRGAWMFEDGRWQPLRPHAEPAGAAARAAGIRGLTFGPEIGFALRWREARPGEPLGIVKHAKGETDILAWLPPDSSAGERPGAPAASGGQYLKLLQKVREARAARNVKIGGLLWCQGGSDGADLALARRYLAHLDLLFNGLRRDLALPDLPIFLASFRFASAVNGALDLPDDLTGFAPRPVDEYLDPEVEFAGLDLPPTVRARLPGRLRGAPGIQFVLHAQWEIQHRLENVVTVIARDLSRQPAQMHFDTDGQLALGRLFADAYLTFANRSL